MSINLTDNNASTNINAIVPTIAIERIEIVNGARHFTSDAVAGVVNFITKSDFEGFDVAYQFTTDDNTGKGDNTLQSMIWGVQGDRGGIMAAASVQDRDEMSVLVAAPNWWTNHYLGGTWLAPAIKSEPFTKSSRWL